MTDRYFMDFAEVVAGASKDESRKTGCVFVDSISTQIVAFGYNAFPEGVKDTPERRQRPLKYVYTEHAERNAIYDAAKKGNPLKGTTAYVPWFPCADCARSLVQVGVVALVAYEPDWSEERYNFNDARAILEEGGVRLRFLERVSK